MLRPGGAGERRSRAPGLEAGPDLGDVPQAPAAGGGVEAELHRDVGGGEQGELLGVGVVVVVVMAPS